MFVGNQQVFTPVFIGAEPNMIDAGPYAGTTVLRDLERDGLELMAELPEQVRRQATVYDLKRDPAMPVGRLHFGDELHLGGAFGDNRVIPYEGSSVSTWGTAHRDRLLALVEGFLAYQPATGPNGRRRTASG